MSLIHSIINSMMPMKQILEATFNKALMIMNQVHKFKKLMSHIN